MITVDVHECKRCGNEAVAYYEPSLGKTLNRCDNCGWEHTRVPIEGPDGFILDEDCKMTFKIRENNGFGVLNLVYKDGSVKTKYFKKNISDSDADKIAEDFKINDSLKLDECFLSRWNESEKRLEVLFGKLPLPARKKMDL